MNAAIENPTKCIACVVIRFLMAENLSAANIHRALCTLYGQNVKSEAVVRQWVRLFKNRRTNIHDEEKSGRPSVVSDEFVQKIYERVHENRWFTISVLSEQFVQISWTVLYEFRIMRL